MTPYQLSPLNFNFNAFIYIQFNIKLKIFVECRLLDILPGDTVNTILDAHTFKRVGTILNKLAIDNTSFSQSNLSKGHPEPLKIRAL